MVRHEEQANFVRAWELIPEGGEPGLIEFSVPENAAVLTAAVAELDSPWQTVAGRPYEWMVSGPSWSDPQLESSGAASGTVEYVRNSRGAVVGLIVLDPAPGPWTIGVRVADRAAATCVAVFEGPGQDADARAASWVTCRVCKFAIKSLLILILAKLTGGVLLALHLGNWDLVQQALGLLLEALHRTLGLSIEGIRRLLELIADILGGPLDRMAERACQIAGLCP